MFRRFGYSADSLMVIGLIIVAGLIIYSSGIIKKDCGKDKDCFVDKLKDCKTAKVYLLKNDNVYSYTIGASYTTICNIYVKMERIALGADPEFERLLEGKEMQCKVPRDKLYTFKVDDFNSFINYCNGPLKEGLYELIIQRMYTLVVKELSGVLQKAKGVLNEV